MAMATEKHLREQAAAGKGRVVTSNDCSHTQINKARADGRLAVSDDHLSAWLLLPNGEKTAHEAGLSER